VRRCNKVEVSHLHAVATKLRLPPLSSSRSRPDSCTSISGTLREGDGVFRRGRRLSRLPFASDFILLTVVVGLAFSGIFGGVWVVGSSNVLPAAHSSGSGGGIVEIPPIMDITVCKHIATVGTAWYWVPTLIVNSPYGTGSSASGTSGSYISSTISASIPGASFSQESVATNAYTITASDGATEGNFELTEWGIYHVENYSTMGPGDLNKPCTQPYVAAPTDYTGWTQNWQIFGPEPCTCNIPYSQSEVVLDAAVSVYEQSVPTIGGLSDMAYFSDNDAGHGATNSPYTFGTSTTSYASNSWGISLGADYNGLGASGSISYQVTQGSSNSYTYTQAANTNLFWDSLTGSAGGGLAFYEYASGAFPATGCFIPASGGCSTSVHYTPGQTMQMANTVSTASSPVSVQACIDDSCASVHPWSTSATGWTYTIDFGAAPNSPGVYNVYTIVTFSNGSTSWSNECLVTLY
jgi:hypothetical protein